MSMTTASTTASIPQLPEVEDAVRFIREHLRRRTGRAWSVTKGRGSVWGWITITAPARRTGDFGYMSDDDRRVLGEALGLDGPAHRQGVQVPASCAHRREYMERAATGTASEIAEPYWD